MIFYRVVIAVTDISLVDILRLMISCLTGIGALALGTVVIVVAYIVVAIRRLKKSKQTEPLVVDWEAILEEVQK